MDCKIAQACLSERSQPAHAFKQKLLAAEKREIAMNLKNKKKHEPAADGDDTAPVAEKKKKKQKKNKQAKKKPTQATAAPKANAREPSEYMKRKKSFIAKTFSCSCICYLLLLARSWLGTCTACAHDAFKARGPCDQEGRGEGLEGK